MYVCVDIDAYVYVTVYVNTCIYIRMYIHTYSMHPEVLVEHEKLTLCSFVYIYIYTYIYICIYGGSSDCFSSGRRTVMVLSEHGVGFPTSEIRRAKVYRLWKEV